MEPKRITKAMPEEMKQRLNLAKKLEADRNKKIILTEPEGRNTYYVPEGFTGTELKKVLLARNR